MQGANFAIFWGILRDLFRSAKVMILIKKRVKKSKKFERFLRGKE